MMKTLQRWPSVAVGGVLRRAASVGRPKRGHESEGPRAGRHWSTENGSEKLIRGRHWNGVGNAGMGARPGAGQLQARKAWSVRTGGLASV